MARAKARISSSIFSLDSEGIVNRTSTCGVQLARYSTNNVDSKLPIVTVIVGGSQLPVTRDVKNRAKKARPGITSTLKLRWEPGFSAAKPERMQKRLTENNSKAKIPRKPSMKLSRRTFLIVLLPLTLVVVFAGSLWFFIGSQTNAREVHRRLTSELEAILPPEQVSLQLASAELKLNVGLIVRGLSIASPSSPNEPILVIDRLVAHTDALSLARADWVPKRVELNGVQLHLRRDTEGRWQHETIVSHLRQALGSKDRGPLPTVIPNVSLQNAVLRFRDESNAGEPLDIAFHSIDASLTGISTSAAPGSPDVAISLRAENPVLSSVSAQLFWSSREASLEVRRLTSIVDLARHEKVTLPVEVKKWLRELDVGGVLSIDASAKLDSEGRISGLQVLGDVTGGTFVLPRGFRVKALNGTVDLRNKELRIVNLRGLTPAGSVESRGVISFDETSLRQWESGDLNIEQLTPTQRFNEILREFQLSFGFHNVALNEELLTSIPELLREVIEDNQLSGRLSLQGGLTGSSWPPDPMNLTLSLDLLDVGVRPESFPYSLLHCAGSVLLSELRLRTEQPIRASAGAGEVDAVLDLDLTAVPESISGEVKINGRDISGDTTLRNALSEAGQEIWDLFEPSGRGDAQVLLVWDGTEENPRVILTLEPHSGQMAFRYFPLPLHALHGTLKFDLSGPDGDFVEVTGASGTYRGSPVRGDGQFIVKEEAVNAHFDLNCASLNLNSDLVKLLPPRLRDPLLEQRVSGDLGVEVNASTTDGEIWNTFYRLTLSSETPVIVHPPGMAFPFVLSGGVISANEKEIRFQNVVCRDPDGTISGVIQEDGTTRLQGELRQLVLGERFLGLFPESMRADFRELGLRGVARFKFDMEIFPAANENEKARYVLNISELGMKKAGLDAGIRLREVDCGSGNLSISGAFGHPPELRGELLVKSARLNRLEANDVTVHLTYGIPHPAVETGKSGAIFEDSGYVVGQEFQKNLTPSSCSETLQMLVGPAKLYGGQFRGFFFADFSDLGDFRGHFLAENVDLTTASKRIFENEEADSKGLVSAEVRFNGLTGESTRLLGDGAIEIKNASLGKGPVLSKVLDRAKPKSERPIEFTDVNAGFTIHDEKFHARRGDILIKGKGVNLLGSGTMDFNGVLDLVFNFRILRGSDIILGQVTHVQVTGPLSDPRVNLKVLPLLNQ